MPTHGRNNGRNAVPVHHPRESVAAGRRHRVCHDGGVDPKLPGFLNSLAPYLKDYGYLAVAVIVTIESFGPPLPGETIIIAAAIYAGAGSLNIWVVGLVAFAAAVIGDNIGYFIGRKGGRALIDRYGKYFGATPHRFGKAEAFFVKHGRWIVVVARFIEGLRQLNGVIAGTTGMRWRTFALAQVVGAAIWVTCWTTLGYTAGSHVTAVYDWFSRIGFVLFGVLVLLAIAWFVRKRLVARRTPALPTGETSETDPTRP
jgi:membrane protein DedA with SNARE-associated domain